MDEAIEEPDLVLPFEFFTRLVAGVEDIGELKVVLHVAHLAQQSERAMAAFDELLTPTLVRSIVGRSSPEPADQRVRRAVERGLAHGWLFRLTVDTENGPRAYLAPATADNHARVDALRSADGDAWNGFNLPEGEVSIYRPNAYALYERHIGPLTPLVAEALRESERAYPYAWIEAAILTAVEYNNRNWRYIQRILSSWDETGAPDVVSGSRS